MVFRYDDANTRGCFLFRDEELLFQGLALNDSLQCVLARHDEIAKGSPTTGTQGTASSVVLNVNHEDDEPEDEFAQLAHR